MIQTDVFIVGAGPTGLALACQLLRYGVDFRIVDIKETTTPYSKAIGVQARTLEIYEQIGLADDLIALGTKATKLRMFAGGHVRGEADISALGEGLTPYPFILFVDQGEHERVLYSHLLSAGKDVVWRHELTGLEQTNDGVTATVVSGDAEEQITAKYVVGCDGAKSHIRHLLGLEFTGSTFDRMFYVADVELDWQYDHEALQVFLMKNSLLAFFPMKGERRYRIVGTFPEEFAKEEGDILYEEIEEQIRHDSEVDLDITAVNWFSTYRVHTRHVNKFSVGRVFLAGDAAHIHSPAGAQGMNTGIQDGYNLAWKLAYVLQGKAGPVLLDTYNDERLPNAETLTRTTDRLFAIGAGDDPLYTFLRLHVIPYIADVALRMDTVKKFIFPRVSQIAISYGNSRLSEEIGSFSVRAGERMPFFDVAGKSIYDLLRSPRFHLLVFDDGSAKISKVLDEATQDGLSSVDVQILPLYPHIARLFGSDRSFCIVVRPDNYIGLISDDLPPETISRYMSRVLS